MNRIALCFAAALVDVASGIVLGKWSSHGSRPGALLVAPNTSFLDPPWLGVQAHMLNDAAEGQEFTRTPKGTDYADCASLTEPSHPFVWDSAPTEDDLKAYQGLFKKWNGKSVVLAGDSLMRELWATLGCAASLLNGSTQSAVIEQLAETDGGVRRLPNKGPYSTTLEKGKSTAGIAAAHSKMEVRLPENVSFQMHFLLFYANRENPADYDGGELMISNSRLAAEVAKYDRVYINSGHAPFQDEFPCSNLTVQLVDAIAAKGLRDVTFIEHPPTHFKTTNGEYDPRFGHLGCKCHPLEVLKSQTSYKCERESMQSYLHSKGVGSLATWFESMADHCDDHFPESNDCAHFHADPTLHHTLVSNMERLTL